MASSCCYAFPSIVIHSKPPPPNIPNMLGLYEVGGVLAGGGMATIYLGRPYGSRGAQHLVALKVIKDEFVRDVTYVNMFLDEARILSRLSHPNVVKTLEFGISGDHRFIAMELLVGRPLSDVWNECEDRATRIPPALAAGICARVGRGLHYAHDLKDENGTALEVIHRDVNPTNIFITYDGAVKLIDFGLAKSVGRKARSAEGIVKGKVPYLSPEQLAQSKIDRRTDVYTLGATLWELTVGTRLFKRDSDADTIKAILRRNIPDPTELIEGYPPQLWSIIRRALETSLDARYPTAAAMSEDIDAFVQKSDEEIALELKAFLAELFPGERESQLAMLQKATMR